MKEISPILSSGGRAAYGIQSHTIYSGIIHSLDIPGIGRHGVAPFSFAEVARVYDDVDLGGPWPCAYAFHFGTLPGCVGTWFALAACLKLTGGLAFDPQEGKVLTAEKAIRYASDTETGIDRIESHLGGAPRN